MRKCQGLVEWWRNWLCQIGSGIEKVFMVEVEIPWGFQGRMVGRGEGLVGLVMTGWVCSFAIINISGKIDLAMKQ